MESSSTRGGVTVKVVLDESVHHQGHGITGTVYITGEERERQLDSVRIELRERWVGDGEDWREKVWQTSVLEKGPVAMAPNLERDYEVALQLPRNCRLTNGNEGWAVVATGDRRRALDIHAELTLEVMPAKALLAVVEACESRLGYTREAGWVWNEGGFKPEIRFAPPVELRQQIDYLHFHIKQHSAGGIVGHLFVRFSRKSILDSLLALTARGKRNGARPSFGLAEDQLLHTDGEVNEERIAQYVRGLVDEAIRERDSILLGRFWCASHV